MEVKVLVHPSHVCQISAADQDPIAGSLPPIHPRASHESSRIPYRVLARKSDQAMQLGFPQLTGTALRGGHGVGMFSEMQVFLIRKKAKRNKPNRQRGDGQRKGRQKSKLRQPKDIQTARSSS